ncbi:hypothetical protein KAI58_02085 [Candidatus Gracilibacteria bacterium]|nr:hypothetical protein [Candidatus Gracilibacteria bacterium]
MAGFVIFSIFSPYFNLKKISIIRDNPNIDIEKIETSLQEFYGENLLFLSHEDIEKQLLNTFLEFRKIDISENWPSEMQIKITISPPLFTLFNIETANFSVISEDGIILSEKPQSQLVVLKIQEYKKTLFPGEKFTKKETLDKIKQAKFALEHQIKLPIKEILFFPTARELHIISEKDTAIWIDLQLEIEPQIRKLELSTNEIGLFSKNIKHIDLRIPKQIFWK